MYMLSKEEIKKEETRVLASLAIDAHLSMTNAIYGPVYREIPSKHNGKVDSVKDKM